MMSLASTSDAHELLGGRPVLLDPAAVHVDEVDVVVDAFAVCSTLVPLTAIRVRVGHGSHDGEAVDVAALEGRQHLGRLDIDHVVVGGVQLELREQRAPEDLAAGARATPTFLPLSAVEVVDVAADHRHPLHEVACRRPRRRRWDRGCG